MAKKKPDGTDDDRTGKLTEKMKSFCNWYLSTGGNGTEAAELAGYSAKSKRSLAEAARKLLKNPRVHEHLAELAKDMGAATAIEMQLFWTRAMRGHPMRQMVRGELVIAPFEAKAQVTASQLLAKSQGMFIEKIELEQKGGVYVLLPDNGRDDVRKLPRRVSSEEELGREDDEGEDDD